MADDHKVRQVGTGQQGSGSHGVNWEKSSHLNEQTDEQKVDEAAGDAAAKGMDRQRRDDPTIFTK